MLAASAACSSNESASNSAASAEAAPAATTLAPPMHGDQIVTPTIRVEPGEEKFLCYSTSLSTTEAVGVKSYASRMTAGSHHMILYATDTPLAEDGAIVDCSGMTAVSGKRPPVWTYASQEPEGTLEMPSGVGVVLGARQHLIVDMHYLNASAEPLDVHVTVNVETYAPGEEYTPAAAFVTYNTQIDVPPKGKQTVEGTCDVPAGARFFALSTHSHRYTKRATISDGDRPLVETTDWEHPATGDYRAPFLELATGKLSYRCDYENPTDAAITVGESATKNEMCMAVGYFFPATKSGFCLNSVAVKR